MTTQHWLIALGTALSLHVLIGLGLIAYATKPKAMVFELSNDNQAITVGLSSATPPAPEPVAETLPEPQTIVEQAQPPVEPPKPVVKPEPKPKPDPKPVPKKEPKPAPTPVVKSKPEPQPEPVPETAPVQMQTAKVANSRQAPNLSPSTQPTTTASAPAVNNQPRALTAQQKKAADNYFNKIMQRLLRYKKYPLIARKKKQEGTVTVEFTFNKNGKVISQRITQSSGYKKLDDAALKMVAKASPLPAIPDSMGKREMTINVPVSYTLQR